VPLAIDWPARVAALRRPAAEPGSQARQTASAADDHALRRQTDSNRRLAPGLTTSIIAIGLDPRRVGITIARSRPAPRVAIVRYASGTSKTIRRVVLVAVRASTVPPRIAVVLNAIQEISEGEHRRAHTTSRAG